MWADSIREKASEREILLMTHIVMGYPTFEESLRVVEEMVAAGVDMMELQIPFSEPIADGPVILHANQRSLQGGSTVERCLVFAEEVARRFDIPFFVMTYYNILFKYGASEFAARMSKAGLAGAIVPDLPPEEAEEYLHAMGRHGLAPIFIFSPNTSDERMRLLSESGEGFVYCVARKGVTGAETSFSREFGDYLGRCRSGTDLPLALGFGVKSSKDVDFLRGKVEIAIVGTESIRVLDQEGIEGVRPFIEGLRPGTGSDQN